ncbi:MAG: FHA domain-containing protein [Tannerella sp.]|jgi:hypothetical protein|nr:FHA domain-containing protein [Tannerella sp.]
MERRITVGRDPSSDIHVSEAYDGVSRNHANIYYNNGRVIYEDISTNGSFVNNNAVHRTKIEIFPNDMITLGRNFVLSWSMIDNALSLLSQKPTEAKGPAYGPAYGGNNGPHQMPPSANFRNYNYGDDAGTNIERELNSWNWGAFFFGWLWGIFNGVYWPLVVLIPYIGWIAMLIINIVLGIKGNVWAWKGRYWKDFNHFKRVQKSWSMWALYIFIISIVLSIFFTILFFSVIASALR